MMEDLGYDNEGFYDLQVKNKYAKYLQFFYCLQRYNETHNLPNFALIPILQHGRHHTTIDTKSLTDILSRLKKSKFDSDSKMWNEYFKFNSLERGKKFRGSISTDGISVFLSMEAIKNGYDDDTTVTNKIVKRKKSSAAAVTTTIMDKNLLKIQRNKNEYKQFIGLDPGCKLMVGGVVKTREQLSTRKASEFIKIRSAHFTHLTGYAAQKNERELWTSEIDAKSATTTFSPMSHNYIEYTRHRLLYFEHKQQAYEQPEMARVKFDKYRRTEQAAHKLARQIIGKDEGKTLIIIGSSKIAANSPIRGYRRVPQPKLLQALKLRADVLRKIMNFVRQNFAVIVCNQS